MSNRRSLRSEHAQASKRTLLDAARRLFTSPGFAATSLDQIAEASGLTKGAVYHHFDGKQDVFRSVYEELAEEVAQSIAREVAHATGPIDRARAGIEALLAAGDDPAVVAIMFRDAMGVLAGECRRIDERHYLGILRELVEDLARAGLLAPVDTGILARLLLAVLIEASAILGAAEDIDAARAQVRGVLEQILFGLLLVPR